MLQCIPNFVAGELVWTVRVGKVAIAIREFEANTARIYSFFLIRKFCQKKRGRK